MEISYICAPEVLRSLWVCLKSYKWPCSWAGSLRLCLLPSDVCSGASESVMKLGFVFFWRPFPCEDQQPPCNNFALQSQRFGDRGVGNAGSVWSTRSFCQKTKQFGAPCPLQSCCLAAHGPCLRQSPARVEKGLCFFGLQMF